MTPEDPREIVYKPRVGRRPKWSWTEQDYVALARKVEAMDPAKYDQKPMSAKELVRRLTPRLLAAILEGKTDIHGIHSMLAARGIHVTLRTLQEYIRAGVVAEPRKPGTGVKKKWNQKVYDAKVREVCTKLPREQVGPRVWARWEELQAWHEKRDATRP